MEKWYICLLYTSIILMSENNRSDYEKEKEARERRLRAYAEEIQKQILDTVALRAHVAGQVVHRARHGTPVFFLGKPGDHPLDILAVMLKGDTPLRVSHPARRNGQLLTRRLRVWRVHIELEIRHYEKVIPQFVGEVGRIAQQGVQVAHHGDHGI